MRRIAALACAVSLLVGLAGCGGDEVPEPSGATASTEDTGAPVAERAPLSFVVVGAAGRPVLTVELGPRRIGRPARLAAVRRRRPPGDRWGCQRPAPRAPARAARVPPRAPVPAPLGRPAGPGPAHAPHPTSVVAPRDVPSRAVRSRLVGSPPARAPPLTEISRTCRGPTTGIVLGGMMILASRPISEVMGGDRPSRGSWPVAAS